MGTHSDLVKNDIFNRLEQRKLLPGDPVDEKDMQKRLSISATPMREALINLEAQGIVERRRRGGAIISELDLEGMLKSCEALSEMDGSMAALASLRINPKQAKVLREKAQATMDIAWNLRSGDFYRANQEFHLAIGKASGNELLLDYTLRVGRRIFPYLSLRQEPSDERKTAAKEHVGVCEAILDSNPQRARHLMVKHNDFPRSVALTLMNAARSSS